MREKLTRKDIDSLAREIRHWASSNRLGKDWLLFWNGKMFTHEYDLDSRKYHTTTRRSVNPLDYCRDFPENFVAGMAYDGTMYECINGYSHRRAYDELVSIVYEYGLYLEHADSFHCAFVPVWDDMTVEYTRLKRATTVWLVRSTSPDAPEDVARIMDAWFSMCTYEPGDEGSCVCGAYLHFMLRGIEYRMSPQSPWQGSLSWERPLPKVERMLEDIGATDIYYYPGNLD